MWPFQRKVEAPAAEGPRPVPAPVIRRDWAGMPPIQRIVGAHPLTAPSDQFSDDLATHQDPSVTSDTMGHQVSADAPPGLVLALARPTTRSDGPAMIPRPRVQRSVASAVTESGEWDGDEAAPDLARPTPVPTSALAIVARELPVVAAEPAVQRLTSLAPGADPAPIAPVAPRSRAVPTSAAATVLTPSNELFEAAPVFTQRLTLGQSRRLGLGAPIKQVPDHSVQRAADNALPLAHSPVPTLPQRGNEPMEASSVEVPTDIPAVQRVPTDAALVQRMPTDVSVPARPSMDLAPSTKVPMDLASGVVQTMPSTPGMPPVPSLDAIEAPRLDLPLARTSAREDPAPADRKPIIPTVQRSATSSPAIDSSPVLRPSVLRPIVQRRADYGAPVPATIESEHAPAMPLAPASGPTVVTPSIQRVTDRSARLPAVTAAPASDAAMAPLVGARPLRPTTTLQRSASADGSAVVENTTHPESLTQFPVMTMRDDTPLPDTPLPDHRPQGSEFPFDTPSQGRREFPLMRVRDDTPLPDPPQQWREFRSSDVPSRPLPLAPSVGIAVQRASDNARPPDPTPQHPTDTLQAGWDGDPRAVSR